MEPDWHFPEYNLPPIHKDFWYYPTKIAEALATTMLGCLGMVLGVILAVSASYIAGTILWKLLGKLYRGLHSVVLPWEGTTFFGFIVLLVFFSGWGLGTVIVNQMRRWHLW